MHRLKILTLAATLALSACATLTPVEQHWQASHRQKAYADAMEQKRALRYAMQHPAEFYDDCLNPRNCMSATHLWDPRTWPGERPLAILAMRIENERNLSQQRHQQLVARQLAWQSLSNSLQQTSNMLQAQQAQRQASGSVGTGGLRG